MSRLDQLWAGWRHAYVSALGDGIQPEVPGTTVPEGSTLFEAIEQSGLEDSETFILHRGGTLSLIHI